MSQSSPDVPEGVKVMAAIGHVCLQWARLEMALLGVIYAIEKIPMEKGELIYGGLDMLPRINMAIRLAEHEKIPLHLQKRLRDVRSALQGKRTYDGLAARRNQIVHGAHKDEEGGTTLTMVRWRGDQREKAFTAIDINNVAVELLDLGSEAWAIFHAIGDWQFPDHGSEDKPSKRAEPNPAIWIKIAKHLRTRLQHLWSQL